MENQAGMISRFWKENDYLPLRGEITRMRWLGKQKEGKQTNAMVIEFEDSKVANGLLMTVTATWGASQRKLSGTTESVLLRNALMPSI